MNDGFTITPNKFGNYNERTDYVHKDGPIVISQGIGRGTGPWGVFIQKPNGSLKRFKPIEMCTHQSLIRLMLENYKGKALIKTSVNSVAKKGSLNVH